MAATEEHFRKLFDHFCKATGGKPAAFSMNPRLRIHPSGGCRMGADPRKSVCSSHGRTHDHDNLYVVGAPTLPSGGCTNATLTFAALALRSTDEIVAR